MIVRTSTVRTSTEENQDIKKLDKKYDRRLIILQNYVTDFKIMKLNFRQGGYHTDTIKVPKY